MPKKPKKSPVLCLDCLGKTAKSGRCTNCNSRRLVSHPELDQLEMAHLDCDAFYAAVEKRDDPKLAGKPLIIGGGRRGVVATCCYIARLSGVKSAMPMFKARKLCPKAVVMPSNMAKYAAVSREIRALMRDITPLVEPLSVDEAFLDLSGTRRLHRAPPATTLARLLKRIEDEIGITASVGLSYNKFLAKVASDLSKPRGFSVIGRADALKFLEPQPISIIGGVGKSLQRRLERDGLLTIGQLRGLEESELMKRYGVIGQRLYRLSRGQDARAVHPHQPAKSISSETTLDQDLYRYEDLERVLWRQVESVSRSLKSKNLAGRTITLKLKPSRLKTVTRSATISAPTQMAHLIFERAAEMLKKEAGGRPYRLVGVGMSQLIPAGQVADEDLFERSKSAKSEAERAVDALQKRFGIEAIKKGRSL